ncbi:MAG: hypothetical protein GX868_00705 [Actinobacteria bacterium]|nr:hypothetical protein [Actinomycetota bacterium]
MNNRRFASGHTLAALLSLALVAAACSDTGTAESESTGDPTPATVEATAMERGDQETLRAALGDGSCDVLDTFHCLLPFPSNGFVADDAETDTGKRVSLPTGQLANVAGDTLDVSEWNRNDGFSPNSPVVFSAPGVDLEASGVATIGAIAASLEDTSPTVLVDLESGKRLAHWVELDANAPVGEQLVIIRPASALPEGAHIGVIVGELVDEAKEPLEASLATAAYRDGLLTDIAEFEDRRASLDEVYAAATTLGYDRASLYAAWDFTVASQRSLSERLLHIRDDAFERLGDEAPRYAVTEVVTADLHPGIGRRVEGTFQVPLYLEGDGVAGTGFSNAVGDGLPVIKGSYTASFVCQIPQGALDGGGATTRPVVYGHGLLGSVGEARNSQVAKIAATNNMMYCATNWIGMSEDDLANAVKVLGNLSSFGTLADRTQQGILNTLFLARLMRHEQGFAAGAEFAATNGAPILDTTEVYYDGNSQGGIIGGAATAVSTEWTKAVLGVPGMNYSLLLSRSVDFDEYFTLLRNAYPSAVDQAIIYPLLQMLWDRAESAGYAQHLTTDPYAGTPSHQVVLDVAFGDHQVAQVAAEVMARTIGAGVRGPALADGRHRDARPFFGLDVITKFPTDRSVLVYWDSGTLAPPAANITPRESEEWIATCSALSDEEKKTDPQCADPHEDPRRAPGSIEQKDRFFRPDGQVIDPCDGAPCVAVNRRSLNY